MCSLWNVFVENWGDGYVQNKICALVLYFNHTFCEEKQLHKRGAFVLGRFSRDKHEMTYRRASFSRNDHMQLFMILYCLYYLSWLHLEGGGGVRENVAIKMLWVCSAEY
jgi:hypothetical protein